MKYAWLGIILIGSAMDAQATGNLADIQILDRDSGAALQTYRYHGENWVAGRPGARYSIVIQNHRGQRILAVTTVDGINVISGETGAWSQTGYVFSPGQSYEIAGWRKSDSEIAAFNFTAASNSYAERTGRAANIGVVGVALFLERPVRATNIAPFDQRYEDSAARGAPLNAPQSAGIAESSIGSSAAPAPKLEEVKPRADALAQKLGTGHGARETSYVQNTQFERMSNTPNEIIRIRYDSFENLVAMGVVPSRQRPWTTPNPFPDSSLQKYVPDPPGG
jgi:hypothetical protein